jgi:hypothetical protein
MGARGEDVFKTQKDVGDFKRTTLTMPTLPLVFFRKEAPPASRNIRLWWRRCGDGGKSRRISATATSSGAEEKGPYTGAERIGGRIGCEHDYAHTVVQVEEFIGSDKVVHDW